MNTLDFLKEKTLAGHEFATLPFSTTDGFVIYDCDAGSDDAWGLLMLLQGEKLSTTNSSINLKSRTYKILGVTCTHGNTNVNNVTLNCLRVLQSAKRKDIPVFKGCAEPMLSHGYKRTHYFHGKDGFGDLQYEENIDIAQLRAEHAVNAMFDLACKYPKKVDFILVGPLTNFAMCINMYGEEFLSNVRNIYIMGGNYRAKGNITKTAEFNFMMDPEAAYIVLEKVKSFLVILPWETCIDGDFGLTLDWRFKVLGGSQNETVKLLNRVEEAILIPRGFEKWIVCDAMLVAAYIFPESVETVRTYHTTVELTGTHTRGQMVLDHLRHKNNNTLIIQAMDKVNYKNVISWTAGL